MSTQPTTMTEVNEDQVAASASVPNEAVASANDDAGTYQAGSLSGLSVATLLQIIAELQQCMVLNNELTASSAESMTTCANAAVNEGYSQAESMMWDKIAQGAGALVGGAVTAGASIAAGVSNKELGEQAGDLQKQIGTLKSSYDPVKFAPGSVGSGDLPASGVEADSNVLQNLTDGNYRTAEDLDSGKTQLQPMDADDKKVMPAIMADPANRASYTKNYNSKLTNATRDLNTATTQMELAQQRYSQGGQALSSAVTAASQGISGMLAKETQVDATNAQNFSSALQLATRNTGSLQDQNSQLVQEISSIENSMAATFRA